MKKIIITDDMWNAVDDDLGGGVGNYSITDIFGIPDSNEAHNEMGTILNDAAEKASKMRDPSYHSKAYCKLVDTTCRKLYRIKKSSISIDI